MVWVVFVILVALLDTLLYFWWGFDLLVFIFAPGILAAMYFGVVFSTCRTPETDENEAIMSQYTDGAPPGRR